MASDSECYGTWGVVLGGTQMTKTEQLEPSAVDLSDIHKGIN